MINSRFSNLVYRIIGKPEIIHDEYSSIMNKALDEIDSFTDPSKFFELEVGNQILSRIENSDEAVRALSTLLDNGRFKIIILDEALKPIYNNNSAKKTLESLKSQAEKNVLNASLIQAIKSALTSPTNKQSKLIDSDSLIPLNYKLNSDEKSDQQIYLKTVTNTTNSNDNKKSNFHLLLVLDQTQKNALNPQLVAKYQLTQKEQNVLIGLIHGSSIKEIAANEFVSDNTIKTHLKSLFRKTDTKSQTQVVGLILTHESQVLDSYFNSGTGIAELNRNDSPDKTIELSGGDIITYREYGPCDGDVVIVFHNSYGSRLMIPNDYHEICQRTNRRVIIPDRPGHGKTPYIKGHPNQWYQLLTEMIDILKIQQYDVIGAVLGCPLAIHFASHADSRLKRLTLSSPFLINEKSDTKHLIGILAPAQMLVKGSIKFAKQVYELWLKSVTLNLGTDYRNMLESGVGSAEREKFERDGTIELMVDTFREASAETLKGLSNEMVFCLTPCGIDLSKITIPVDLWWGTEDLRFAREGVEKIAAELPNSTLHIKKGYSEHLYFALFEEMLEKKQS